ncbi:hypothetical protein N7535_009559 [Penicillium sp. DV-2018c]|nr:hypothetical protein N7535_009559 [Penicillium sp. DV-2018c]
MSQYHALSAFTGPGPRPAASTPAVSSTRRPSLSLLLESHIRSTRDFPAVIKYHAPHPPPPTAELNYTPAHTRHALITLSPRPPSPDPLNQMKARSLRVRPKEE